MTDSPIVAHRAEAAEPAKGARNSVRRRRVDDARRSAILVELEALILSEGFTSLTVDDMARRLKCSKSTIYSIAPSKEQLVVAITKRFFRIATESIEADVASKKDAAMRISTYLAGVGSAMDRCSADYYSDLVAFIPTLTIYKKNSEMAAKRVHELIDLGIKEKSLRALDGQFAGQLVALAMDGILSGVLLNETGLTAGQAYVRLADLLLRGLRAPTSS